MNVNADFAKRALVKFNDSQWVPSPMAGVERKMLDRIGDEVARATTIVRFAPGSHFSPHTHDGGEEFLVLDGVFQDEHGDFAAGSYIRNPPTSSHTPASGPGTTILVKLHQFDPADRTHVRLKTDTLSGAPDQNRPGVTVTPLFDDPRETVRLEEWAPGASVTLAAPGGLEVFVLDGGLIEGADALGRWDWLRLPVGATLRATAGPGGVKLWLKSGHLAHAVAGPVTGAAA